MAKTCVICGEDCSDKPRIKDGSGNYACRACFEARQKAAARKPAPPPEPDDDPIAMAPADDDLWADLEQPTADPAAGGGAQSCPTCGDVIKAGNVICTRCGYNIETGKSLKTRIAKPEKESKSDRRSEKKSGFNIAMDGGPVMAFSIMFVANMLPLVLVFADPNLSTVASAISGILGLILLIATAFFAFQNDQSFWGGICIAAAIPCINILAAIPALIYGLFLVPSTGYKAAWAGQLVGGIAGLTIMAAMGISIIGGAGGIEGFLNETMNEDASNQAVQLAQPGEEPWEVDLLLVELADEIITERLQTLDPDDPNRDYYLSFLEEAYTIDDYPYDIQQEAINRLDAMTPEERQQRLSVFD